MDFKIGVEIGGEEEGNNDDAVVEEVSPGAAARGLLAELVVEAMSARR